MGIQNRMRRRQKQAKRRRERGDAREEGRTYHGERDSVGADALAVTLLIAAAAESVHHRREDAPELLGLLREGSPPVHTRVVVARELRAALEDEIGELRAKAWRPSEVQRAVRRKLGAVGVAVVLAAIRSEWIRGHDAGRAVEWAAEVAALDAVAFLLDPGLESWPDDLAAAISVLGLLSHLPRLPGLSSGSDRSAAGSRVAVENQRMLDKVRALLAKAESTSFPEEAAALTAKAQELLSRHSIDRAALSMGQGPARKRVASVSRIWIDDPYLSPKAQLLNVVCLANRCRSVISTDIGLATVAGHEDDLETVEILFTSLLVQATTQMAGAGSRTDRYGRSSTRSFRQSFLVAFAVRIGERLREAGRTSESDATERYGTALLPVLASRSEAAQDAIDAIFPSLVRQRVSATDRDGWIAGTVAADHASLLVGPELAEFAG